MNKGISAMKNNKWYVIKCTDSYHVFDVIGAEFHSFNKHYAMKLCKYCNENNVNGKTCDMDEVLKNAKVKIAVKE